MFLWQWLYSKTKQIIYINEFAIFDNNSEFVHFLGLNQDSPNQKRNLNDMNIINMISQMQKKRGGCTKVNREIAHE